MIISAKRRDNQNRRAPRQQRPYLGITPVLFFLLVALHGCATLPENTQRTESYVISETDATLLGKRFRDEINSHPEKSGFYLLANGLDAFVGRVALVDLAEKAIDIQYYLYHGDLIGGLLGYKLLQAADRGVRVRMLLDDMGLDGRDGKLSTLDLHPNIEIRVFNPFVRGSSRLLQMVKGLGSVTRRMHNKSLTVDNQATIVGGRNIGNEYFKADPNLAFGDLDVLAIGPVVEGVSSSFDQYWNSQLAYPVARLHKKEISSSALEELRPEWEHWFRQQEATPYIQALLGAKLIEELENKTAMFSWGRAEAVYDNPEKILHSTDEFDLHLAPQLEPFVNGLQKELIILSAYFVPGAEGVKFLTDLCAKGIRVKVLTNSLASTDVAIVHSGYAKYRKELLRGGVELYEMAHDANKNKKTKQKLASGASKASLHAKAFIFDRKYLFIGSFNFDPRSLGQNTELGIVFHSPELGQLLVEGFEAGVDEDSYRLQLAGNGYGGDEIRWIRTVQQQRVEKKVEPATSFWKRLMISIVAFLPIESQL